MPGVAMSMTKAVMPRWRSSAVPVRASRRPQVANCARCSTPSAVDRPAGVGLLGPGAQAGEVRARIGLAEQLAPDLLGGCHEGQPGGQLLGVGVDEECGCDDVDPDEVDDLGASARPSSSHTMAYSSGLMPRPPYSVGQATAARPASCRRCSKSTRYLNCSSTEWWRARLELARERPHLLAELLLVLVQGKSHRLNSLLARVAVSALASWREPKRGGRFSMIARRASFESSVPASWPVSRCSNS